MMTDPKPDVKPSLTYEEWERQCAHYADCAFYTPPDKFLFHHYDEDDILICHRPMMGMEKYVVNGLTGGFYGIYDTRDVTFYIKSGTWIEVDDPEFFIKRDIESLKQQLLDKKQELLDAHK